MAEVLVGMGSNIDAENNLLQAASALRAEFGHVTFSSVYRSPAIGMEGDDFLNACCVFDSVLEQAEIRRCMKALEDAQGRDRTRGSWKPRTIDLDVLMYDGEVIDEELYQYAHAYVPASELVDFDVSALSCEGDVTRVELRL